MNGLGTVWWFDSHLLVKCLNCIPILPTKWDSFFLQLGLRFSWEKCLLLRWFIFSLITAHKLLIYKFPYSIILWNGGMFWFLLLLFFGLFVCCCFGFFCHWSIQNQNLYSPGINIYLPEGSWWKYVYCIFLFQFTRKLSMMSVCEQEEAAEMISEWPVIEQEVYVPGMI